MNRDEIKLEQQLRAATDPRAGGRQPPDNASRASDTPQFESAQLDPETAALAEGWQALGQLLQAANADFRPDAIVKQLRWRLMRERMWRGGALIAAVLLIGVGIAWYANRGAGGGGQPLLPASGDHPLVVHPVQKPTGGDKLATAAQIAAKQPAPAPALVADNATSNTGWDQTLDQEITQADESVHSADTLSNRADDSIDKLDEQLASFGKEVAASSL